MKQLRDEDAHDDEDDGESSIDGEVDEGTGYNPRQVMQQLNQ